MHVTHSMYSTHSTHSTHLEGTAEVAGAGKDPHAEPLAERLRLAVAAEEGENGGSHKHACADGEADGNVCAGGGGVVQASGYPDADAAGPEETPGQQNRTPAARQRKWDGGREKGREGEGAGERGGALLRSVGLERLCAMQCLGAATRSWD